MRPLPVLHVQGVTTPVVVGKKRKALRPFGKARVRLVLPPDPISPPFLSQENAENCQTPSMEERAQKLLKASSRAQRLAIMPVDKLLSRII